MTIFVLLFSEFRECFYLFARSGIIHKLDEITVIMRSLGLSPTINELASYLRQKNGKITFADFLEASLINIGQDKLPLQILFFSSDCA